jgi:hypothetical protein
MNRKIIQQPRLTAQRSSDLLYFRFDQFQKDPADALNYPPEFLHDQTPSGMPPHTLALKIGVIIMLLYNLA